jgi:DHA3 family macrolide efflux protein-like MFS transporter
MTEVGTAPVVPLLQYRPFRMLSYTRFFSRVAQNALNFALVLLITEETGKAFFSSLLVLALVVPSTVAGLVAGNAADALPKRLLVLAGDLARVAVCLYFVQQGSGVAAYYVVAILLATATQFASAAESAILPAIIDRPDLARANAINQAVGGGAQLVGLGLLTPVMLRVFDSEDALFAVCAGLFFVAGVQALFIGSTRSRVRVEVGGQATGGWWLSGWQAIRSDRQVLHASIELTLIASTLIIMGGLIPLYITDTLGLPVDLGALILTPAALGVVLGLRTAGFLARRVPHALLSSVGFVIFVVCLALLAFVNQLADLIGGFGAFSWLNKVDIGSFDAGGLIAMAVVFPLGFAFALVSVAGQTVIDDRVPLHLRGRVGATQGAMTAILSSAPVLGAGALADLIGVAPVMAIVACLIGLAAIANFRSPRHERPAGGRVVV